MARRKARTGADIVFAITVAEMESGRTDAFHVTAPNSQGDILVTSNDWTLTVHADGSHTANGIIPSHISVHFG